MQVASRYSISDLEKLSGIKAHTLRIWEKRFGILNPERTSTNIRYYSTDDLRMLLNIGILNKNGFKISHIVEMGGAEIAEKVAAINIVKSDDDALIDNLLMAMIDLNESRFRKIFSDSILRAGFEHTIEQVIFPFFKRIGVMWQIGTINPAQEHFVSNIVRQKLHVAIDGLPVPDANVKPVVLLFLPENELHELSLLFYNYALRSRGVRTVYLGQSVPLGDVINVCTDVQPGILVTVATNEMSGKLFAGFARSIGKLSAGRKILVSGRVAIAAGKSLPSNVRLFRNLSELLRLCGF